MGKTREKNGTAFAISMANSAVHAVPGMKHGDAMPQVKTEEQCRL